MKSLIKNTNALITLIALFLGCAPSFVNAAEIVTYYHTDAQGSVIGASNSNGDLIWREVYKPYGERIIRPNTENDTWYTGHAEDHDTGLTYMGARWYEPTLGRFLGIDPVGVSPENHYSFNRYAYANNNPYAYVDPDGKSPVKIVKGLYNVWRKTSKNDGNVVKGLKEEFGDIVDNLVELTDGDISLDDGFAIIDLATGFGKEVKSLVGVSKRIPKSPNIDPKDVANKTPSQIDKLAKDKGLLSKGSDPQSGRGSYVDPVTGKQRVLCHPNCSDPHSHVNNPLGERLDINGNVVAPETPDAHLPLILP